jgi:ribonucleotide reductase beta subunit family protein with ferritin-like domain
MQSPEPLLSKDNFRLTLKPINPTFEIFWKIYKKQQQSYWTAEDIDFSDDVHDFVLLTDNEQHFVKMILAFFAASDGIVITNLRERFLQEIQVPEVQLAYGFQLMMEGIHAESYSDMLINIISDPVERNLLINAIETIPCVKNINDWAFKWINSTDHFGYRVIAFAIFEGVFFSGAFAAIFWLKKIRGIGKLFMEGLVKSNRFISRDEGMHVNFACVMYSFVTNKVPEDKVYSMIEEAVSISQDFIENAVRGGMIGMDMKMMNNYIKYVSDRLLIMLGYNKYFNTQNPFDFMETIGLLNKDNFFENRPDSYQAAHNEQNTANWNFKCDDDF